MKKILVMLVIGMFMFSFISANSITGYSSDNGYQSGQNSENDDNGQNGNQEGVLNQNQTRLTEDEIQERVQEHLRQKNCTCENITLNEDGNYEIQTQKKAKLFGLFNVREQVRLEYDSGTGELVRQQNSWWGFLAKDVVEEEQ